MKYFHCVIIYKFDATFNGKTQLEEANDKDNINRY